MSDDVNDNKDNKDYENRETILAFSPELGKQLVIQGGLFDLLQSKKVKGVYSVNIIYEGSLLTFREVIGVDVETQQEIPAYYLWNIENIN